MIANQSSQDTFALVAESDNLLIGYVILSPLIIKSQTDLKSYILAPVAVMPEQQKCQIGSRLIQQGLKILEERKTHLALVYGDPDYYKRFGFDPETAVPYITPYKLQYPFGWQALQMIPFDMSSTASEVQCCAC